MLQIHVTYINSYSNVDNMYGLKKVLIYALDSTN